jgi:hypothetical protein
MRFRYNSSLGKQVRADVAERGQEGEMCRAFESLCHLGRSFHYHLTLEHQGQQPVNFAPKIITFDVGGGPATTDSTILLGK